MLYFLPTFIMSLIIQKNRRVFVCVHVLEGREENWDHKEGRKKKVKNHIFQVITLGSNKSCLVPGNQQRERERESSIYIDLLG